MIVAQVTGHFADVFKASTWELHSVTSGVRFGKSVQRYPSSFMGFSYDRVGVSFLGENDFLK